MVGDNDFDGYFDLDFNRLSSLVKREKPLLVETILGKGYSCTNYFSDYPHPTVVDFVAQHGFPWIKDRGDKLRTQASAASRRNNPTAGADSRYRDEAAKYLEAEKFLRQCRFFASVRDPRNLDQVAAYFAEKYAAGIKKPALAKQKQFIRELSMVKQYLFCVALVERNDSPIDPPVAQVDLNLSFPLNAASMKRLSVNHWGQSRADCDLLMKFDAAIYTAVGLDVFYVPTYLLGASVGHGLAIGLPPRGYAQDRNRELELTSGTYFAGNNFDAYIVTPSQIYSSQNGILSKTILCHNDIINGRANR